MKYTYQLHPVDKPLNATYTYEELQQLTTLQLREICHKEKLVIGVMYKLDRPYIINTILKYRGAKLFTFVNTYLAERYERVLSRFNSFLQFSEASDDLHMPTRITLYKKVKTTINDNYVIEGIGLVEGNLFLLNDKKHICGILNIKKSEGIFYLTCNNELLSTDIPEATYKNYSLGFLEDAASRYLYNYYYEIGNVRPTKINCYVKHIAELLIVDTQETSTALVIDFGTSNSAAGAYIDGHYVDGHIKADLRKNGINMNNINKVKFINTMSRTQELSEIIPTVVSIKECGNEKNTVYRFGYDAIKNARKNSYNNPASIFYGIKKWVNDYNKIEEVTDEDGNITSISRKEILRAYFGYIISVSEQQHKCHYTSLHITSPVKQKQQFLEMYKEILHDYKIIVDTALDEGIAVLYNSISNQIENNKFEDGDEYNALIIDCGGGTTDLTSCTYYIEDNQITYRLNLTTTYANGETNFGGNNITFRIFQYLKIIFERYYNEESIPSIEDIFHMDLPDIYRYVDTNGHDSMYRNLELLYVDNSQ